MTKTSWAEYVKALSENQREISERTGIAQSTISRWLSGASDPDARQVVQLARSYQVSAVRALVAAGYLNASEIVDAGVQPRALALHEFSERELAVEILRRVDQGSTELEQPVDADHPAMQEFIAGRAGSDVGAADDTDPLANVTQLSRRESREVRQGAAAKRRQRKKDDQADD